ncbi:DNA transformation protein [Methylopila capsulata]|uniref:Competence protein TfoX n=1 Tax=Methylopila capsulata TaxID=61654 RepID=A0A9W6ITG3_9HYPH|nr:TfoX/Sxy family protein [Methylopila capsulata]MBM7849987.1 DNA transformation protein [Methylopila capsulata]GLK55279.1 competence protein TfoX [Methylopila capsulata]
MALDAADAAEMFRELGPVQVRRMFGGAGVYHAGVMFALEAGGTLYLKADPGGAEAFRAEGCEPFSYETTTGRRTITSFWRAPERLMDEPDELAVWARHSVAIALAKKSAAKPRGRGRGRKGAAS